MAIDQFSTARFESVLSSLYGKRWEYAGMDGNERCYAVRPDGSPAGYSIRLRSTIGASGIADEAGEDSIRAVIWDDKANRPHGGKNVRWVSRVNGWDRRMSETLAALATQLLRLIPCPSCKSMVVPFTAQTEKNKGRPFIKCMNKDCKGQLYQWTDVPAPVVAPVDPAAPTCPKCKGPMVRMGSGKGWRCNVPGNRWQNRTWTICDGVVWDKCRVVAAPVQAAPVVPDDAELIDADDDDSPVLDSDAYNTRPVAVSAPVAAFNRSVAADLNAKLPPVQAAPNAFPVDAPRPVRSAGRIDPETSRFVKMVQDAAAMLASGAIDLTPAVKQALDTAAVNDLVSALDKLIA